MDGRTNGRTEVDIEATASYDEIKQKVITQADDYHRVKAYTP